MAARTRLFAFVLVVALSACAEEFDGGGTGNGGSGGSAGRGGSGGRTGGSGGAAPDGAVADGPQSDRPSTADGPSPVGYVRGDVGVCTTPPTTKKAMGQVCGCNAECATGFCVDGVCCSSACTGS